MPALPSPGERGQGGGRGRRARRGGGRGDMGTRRQGGGASRTSRDQKLGSGGAILIHQAPGQRPDPWACGRERTGAEEDAGHVPETGQMVNDMTGRFLLLLFFYSSGTRRPYRVSLAQNILRETEFGAES